MGEGKSRLLPHGYDPGVFLQNWLLVSGVMSLVLMTVTPELTPAVALLRMCNGFWSRKEVHNEGSGRNLRVLGHRLGNGRVFFRRTL